jgi:hypothetical protein
MGGTLPHTGATPLPSMRMMGAETFQAIAHALTGEGHDGTHDREGGGKGEIAPPVAHAWRYGRLVRGVRVCPRSTKHFSN